MNLMEQIVKTIIQAIRVILSLLPHNKLQIPILIKIKELLKVLRSCCKKLSTLHKLLANFIFLNPRPSLLQLFDGVTINLIYYIQYHKKSKTILISVWVIHLIFHLVIT